MKAQDQVIQKVRSVTAKSGFRFEDVVVIFEPWLLGTKKGKGSELEELLLGYAQSKVDELPTPYSLKNSLVLPYLINRANKLHGATYGRLGETLKSPDENLDFPEANRDFSEETGGEKDYRGTFETEILGIGYHDFDGFDFSDSHLDLFFELCRIENCLFKNQQKSEFNLEECELKKSDFSSSNFEKHGKFVVLNSSIEDCKFSEMTGNFESWSNSFENCDFSKSNLDVSHLSDCGFEGCSFVGAKWGIDWVKEPSNLKFINCNFENATLICITSEDFEFNNCNFENATLVFENCYNFRFINCTFKGTKFKDTTLIEPFFAQSPFVKVNAKGSAINTTAEDYDKYKQEVWDAGFEFEESEF